MLFDLPHRPRRNRKSASIRSLVAENHLRTEDFILPIFVQEGQGAEEIPSMPGVYRHGIESVLDFLGKAHDLGIRAVAPFPAIDESLKDSRGSESANPDGLYPRTIASIKESFPDIAVFSDVALDPYSSDGHDGIVKNGKILNDETLEVLAEMAVAQARAGADFVAPSDMMDGRVGYIRSRLDNAGFTDTGILSYCAKYASSFYGPFRDALQSAPKAGDKKTYQMDPANRKEAMREYALDLEEGADMVMVKPGLPYLDVVHALSQISDLPVAVYNVSGEYAMLRAASEKGWLDYRSCVLETLLSMKRAGADLILSYHAMEVCGWLRE